MKTPELVEQIGHQSKDILPKQGQSVIVVCAKFRCLGFIDDEGLWRDMYRNKRLEDVLGWYPLEK